MTPHLQAQTAKQSNGNRITAISLDVQSNGTSSTEIEIERRRAVNDLMEQGDFSLIHPEKDGPYGINIGIEKGLFIFCVQTVNSNDSRVISMGVSTVYQLLCDYRTLSEEFYKLARLGQIARMEALDAKRRDVHDKGATMITAETAQHIRMDQKTAQRLFTLLYVLLIKQSL